MAGMDCCRSALAGLLLISSGQIGCDSVVNIARFRIEATNLHYARCRHGNMPATISRGVIDAKRDNIREVQNTPEIKAGHGKRAADSQVQGH